MVSRSSSLSNSLSNSSLERTVLGCDVAANSVSSHHIFHDNNNSVFDVASNLWEKATTFGVDEGGNVEFHVEAINCLEENDNICYEEGR